MAADGIPDSNETARQLISALGTSVHHCNNNINNLAQGIWNSQSTLHHATGVMQQGFGSVGQGAAMGGRRSPEGHRGLKAKKVLTKIEAQDARFVLIMLAQFEVARTSCLQ